jgi:precorrin-6A/cobalt-precorrin-6A reductase
MRKSILILGGTTEARQLAQALSMRLDIAVTLSLAGRTAAPLAQPVPVRSGGFGGVSGLAQYLRAHQIAAVLDATHPYAAKISANALAAAAQTQTPLAVLHRAPWAAVVGDQWLDVPDANAAVRALGAEPRRVFLALGRQDIGAFVEAPQHRYLIRSVDPIEPPLKFPHAQYIQARGPFEHAQERRLLQAHATEFVIAKNSGGSASYGKIAAARALSIPVLLLRRPATSASHRLTDVGTSVAWLNSVLAGMDRGV